jgi:hypothetical protein
VSKVRTQHSIFRLAFSLTVTAEESRLSAVECPGVSLNWKLVWAGSGVANGSRGEDMNGVRGWGATEVTRRSLSCHATFTVAASARCALNSHVELKNCPIRMNCLF